MARHFQNPDIGKGVVPIGVTISVAWGLVGVGVLLENRSLGSIIPFGIALLAGYISLFRIAPSGVVLNEHGLIILNPFSKKRVLRWDQVAQFKLDRWGLHPATGFVETRDGEQIHIFAIHAPNQMRGNSSPAHDLIKELNEILAINRTVD